MWHPVCYNVFSNLYSPKRYSPSVSAEKKQILLVYFLECRKTLFLVLAQMIPKEKEDKLVLTIVCSGITVTKNKYYIRFL